VHKDGFLQPHDLAKYHIVLTTYETLRKELDYADLNTTDAHRYKKYCVTWSVMNEDMC
jgi:SNF2 family DNA or RNA helicase